MEESKQSQIRSLLSAGKFREAQKFFKDSLLNETESDSWSDYAYICILASDLSSAEPALEKSLEIDPQNIKAIFNRGFLNMQKQEWAAASEDFLKTRSSSQANPKLEWNLGLCSMHLKDYLQAIKYFQSALKIQPNFWRQKSILRFA